MISSEEQANIEQLTKKLLRHQVANSKKEILYEGKERVDDLGVSTPPRLAAVKTVVGWAAQAVQALEEGVRLDAFRSNSEEVQEQVDEIFTDNHLRLRSSMAHIDSFTFGTSFAVIGAGDAEQGEPKALITAEPPTRMTARYDLRSGRVDSALLLIPDSTTEGVTHGSLFLPNETIQIVSENNMSKWTEVDRDEHGMNIVPVVQLINNPRAGDTQGRSEITRAIRYYIDAAMRTLLGAEIAREFYSSPQRFVLGAPEEFWVDEDGNKLNPWTVIQGRTLAVPTTEDNDGKAIMPQVGQFAANSPQPYIELVELYAKLVAAEAAIPVDRLGFTTVNPASADAIRAAQDNLVARRERRIEQFAPAWEQVARIARIVRGEATVSDRADIRAVFREPSTPTKAAAADAAVKLISAGVMSPHSEVAYDYIGFSESQKMILRDEAERNQAMDWVNALSASQPANMTPLEDTDADSGN